MNPALETERLSLCISTTDDVDLFRSTWGDAEVMKMFGPGVPVLPEYTKQHLDEHIEAYQSDKIFPWSLILKENSEKIGFGYLRWEDDESHTLSIGYLIRKVHWGGTRLTETTLKQLGITFHQMPYNLI